MLNSPLAYSANNTLIILIIQIIWSQISFIFAHAQLLMLFYCWSTILKTHLIHRKHMAIQMQLKRAFVSKILKINLYTWRYFESKSHKTYQEHDQVSGHSSLRIYDGYDKCIILHNNAVLPVIWSNKCRLSEHNTLLITLLIITLLICNLWTVVL